MGRRAVDGNGRSAMEIARRVRHFRTRAKLTQEQLARAGNLTAKFISQIENGHVNVSFAVLHRLVEDGLEMPLAAFFSSDTIDSDGEAKVLLELLANQPVKVRRCAIRLVRALLTEDEEETRKRRTDR